MRNMRKTRPSSLRLESPAWWRWVRRKVGELLQDWPGQFLLACATPGCLHSSEHDLTMHTGLRLCNRAGLSPGATVGLAFSHSSQLSSLYNSQTSWVIFSKVRFVCLRTLVQMLCNFKMEPMFWLTFTIHGTIWLLNKGKKKTLQWSVGKASLRETS